MSVDNRLVEYWRRQLAGRRRLRAAPAPPEPVGPWLETGQRDDPAGVPVGGPGAPSNVVPMAFEDR